MAKKILSRRRFIGAGAAGTLGALLAPQAVFADDEEVELLRWDLVAIAQGVALSGGQDVASNAAGDVVTLTGSGEAAPKRETATGGGTFVHKRAGSEVAHGVYTVTGFQSFKAAGGSLAPTGLIDGIGTIKQTMGGVLMMHVKAVASNGRTLSGVLGVHCALPGIEFLIEEGVTLSVPALNLNVTQAGGFTVFHVLQGEHRD